jgi:hypothetical protein
MMEGAVMEGTTGYWLTRLVLQRSLGLVYLIAFSVAVNQFRPLCGEKRLLPVHQFLRHTSFGESPIIFFLFPYDGAFAVCDWLGITLSLLVAARAGGHLLTRGLPCRSLFPQVAGHPRFAE